MDLSHELERIKQSLIQKYSTSDGTLEPPSMEEFDFSETDLERALQYKKDMESRNARLKQKNDQISGTFFLFFVTGLGLAAFCLLVVGQWLWGVLCAIGAGLSIKLLNFIEEEVFEKPEEIPNKYREVLDRDKYYRETVQQCERISSQRRREIEEHKLLQYRETWLELDPYEFEKKIASLFSRKGYRAIRTRGSGDGGVDIILTNKSEKIAVQCKRYASPVSPAVIRELNGIINNESKGFTKGIVVSTGGFSQIARQEAREMHIRLIGMSEIIKMVESLECE